MEGVDLHGLEGYQRRLVNGRGVVHQRQRRRLNSLVEVVGEEASDAELTAGRRLVEAGGRQTAVESQPVDDQGRAGARLRGVVGSVEQRRFSAEVDQVDVGTVAVDRWSETGVQGHVLRAGVGPDELVDRVEQ